MGGISACFYGYLVGGLEARVGDLPHGELLVVGLLGGDDGRVGGEGEVDARVGHQVGLELCQVDVQGPVKPVYDIDKKV